MKTTTRDEKVAEAIKAIDVGVAALTSGEEWAAFLRMQARFHRYSFGNAMLIYTRCPQATRVAGFEAWKKLGRVVRKGEKGIPIFAPAGMGRATRRNDETGEDETLRTWLRFKVVYVFDVSQTDGEPLPQITRPVEDTPFASSLDALRAVGASMPDVVSSITVRPRVLGESGTAAGWYVRGTKEIVIIDEGSEASKFSTLVHELAHAILHGADDHHSRPECEVEAESTAYVVCSALGLDTSCESCGYVAGWGKRVGSDVIRASGDRIARAAHKILDTLFAGEGERVGEE